MARDLLPCGTYAAYTRHLYHHEDPCDLCREAAAARRREQRRANPRPPKPRAALKPCGTYAAYARHVMHGETPCEDCRQAHREYMRAYRAVSPSYNRARRRAAKGSTS